VNRIIVAVGGSGQMLVHYYAQLLLTGVIRGSFHAHVLDADEPITSLAFLSRFFDDVRVALGGGSRAGEVPQMRFHRLSPNGTAGTVGELLGLQPGWRPENKFHHPVQAFFSAETLFQPLRWGLFGRPALSSVLSLRPALDELQAKLWPTGATVVLACSCIGGTGAGLTVPLLWHLTHVGRGLWLRAAWLGEYFRPRDEEDRPRFRSNCAGVLKAAEQCRIELNCYAFVEREAGPERDPQAEKEARNLRWPEGFEDAYGEATAALHYMLTDTSEHAKVAFQDRCVSPRHYQSTVDWGQARDRLRKSLGRVEALVRHEVLVRLGNEPWPARIWGQQLVKALNSYWRWVAADDPNFSPKQLLKELQEHCRILWKGGSYSLSLLFPALPPEDVRPQDLARVPWPVAPEERRSAGAREDALRQAASALLYAALRGGEA